ncbi:hypothetical protein [Acinetobacter wanghuae]|uniref:hypothetical protein n=1 Tax=Acinetobacter wanghuae TaxID=2662362 RepID=UPI00148F4188|nr:hypothetical protein [Acinetobacter wanghuae]
MDKPSESAKDTSPLESNPSNMTTPTEYVESVRITSERLITAVLKNYQQGGSDEH